MTRSQLANFWLLQKLSWMALRTSPEIMASALRTAALEKDFRESVSDSELMRRAFQAKLDGRTNDENIALQELERRHSA